MVEPVFDQKLGVWKCPICGFQAMSRKVIENHIMREHPDEARASQPQDKPQGEQNSPKASAEGDKQKKPGKKNKKKAERNWTTFKIGNTIIKVEKRSEVEIHEQGGWRFFLTANYVASLHKKRVRVKLVTGEEFEGRLKAKDPYFIGLVLDGGHMLYLNKAHIVMIEPIRSEEGE